eukprot:TRINITY_DN303_c0_g1_i1.p1 TRINITY_DN303_c0_g1~~TRINITY_DN303_c0_g1_i1.p1  ORF type:complete len:122 (-),score=15.60 TRINITY_DN303_c0_g1_i1:297-662(-)
MVQGGQVGLAFQTWVDSANTCFLWEKASWLDNLHNLHRYDDILRTSLANKSFLFHESQQTMSRVRDDDPSASEVIPPFHPRLVNDTPLVSALRISREIQGQFSEAHLFIRQERVIQESHKN